MVERRRLAEGLKAESTPEELAFVKGTLGKSDTTMESKTHAVPVTGNTPISTRIRSDFATAIKRASLERQLSGSEPNTVKDIIEEAIEPWLRSNGYLE